MKVGNEEGEKENGEVRDSEMERDEEEGKRTRYSIKQREAEKG